MPTDSVNNINIWIQIVPGLIGAGSALLGQLLANIFSTIRHNRELVQRENHQRNQFLTPIALRRLEAMETLYCSLQTIIEEKKFGLEDYHKLKRLFMYLPKLQRDRTIGSLTAIIQCTSRNSEKEALDNVIAEIKLVQEDIEKTIGLSAVEKAVRSLSQE